jgi:hypothetical protein
MDWLERPHLVDCITQEELSFRPSLHLEIFQGPSGSRGELGVMHWLGLMGWLGRIVVGLVLGGLHGLGLALRSLWLLWWCMRLSLRVGRM